MNFLPSALLLHSHEQVSLLRSHTGGFSVVSSAECMLYAASEVSVIHRQSVWPSFQPHLPVLYYPPTVCFALTCLIFFLYSAPVEAQKCHSAMNENKYT